MINDQCKIIIAAKSLIIVTTLFIKSLLPSLYQREVIHPSLAKRGKWRFSDLCKFNLRPLINA